MSSEIKFSVLMSIYYKENPEWFRTALNSIVNQTLMPDEIVLVADNSKAKNILQWKPQKELKYSIKTAYQWEIKNAK
jgi:UDP-glucose 4-epimerase